MNAESLLIGGNNMLLRDTTALDISQVLELHRRVFGTSVSAEWFDWKYGVGGGQAVGIWLDDHLIAHCGGLPRLYSHHGQMQHDLQIGDVMVAPEWRGILTRQGPFYHVSRGLYNSRLGVSNPFPVGFGFPNSRHLRLGVKSGVLLDGGKMHELKWSNLPDDGGKGNLRLSPWFWHTQRMQPSSAEFDRTMDILWEQMQGCTRGVVIGERSARYLRWRYVARPDYACDFLLLRRPWRKRPLGVAVLSRPGGLHSPVRWLDWIGPPGLMPWACLMCRQEAANSGSEMSAWASVAVQSALSGTGFFSANEAAGIGIPSASAVVPEDAGKIDWWFMGGDTDFL